MTSAPPTLHSSSRASWPSSSSTVRIVREIGGIDVSRLKGFRRSRRMMCAALACDPPALIADEPASGLDPLGRAADPAATGAFSARIGSPCCSSPTIFRSLSITRTGCRCSTLVARWEWGGPTCSSRHPPPYSQTCWARCGGCATPSCNGIPRPLRNPAQRWPGCRYAPLCALCRPPCKTAHPPPSVIRIRRPAACISRIRTPKPSVRYRPLMQWPLQIFCLKLPAAEGRFLARDIW